jgi:hypothetical protein
MSTWEYFISKAESLDDLIRLLERFLSSDDYVVEENGKQYVVETWARVDTIDGYKIEIYSDEHSPPHFHIVKDSNKLAAYTIDDCIKLSGNLPSGVERKIRFFHECAKDKLIRFWNDTRPGGCNAGKMPEL